MTTWIYLECMILKEIKQTEKDNTVDLIYM